MILPTALLLIMVAMALAIARAIKGPTLQDRILSVNLFGTKTVLFIAIASTWSGTGDFLDIALVYALINFISVIGALQYFENIRYAEQNDV